MLLSPSASSQLVRPAALETYKSTNGPSPCSGTFLAKPPLGALQDLRAASPCGPPFS